MTPAVAYFRVSREKQGISGLGLEAQQTFVYYYARMHGFKIIGHFIEVESGGDNDRSIVNEAIEVCKTHNATLLFSTLDRLTRDVYFIALLKKTALSSLRSIVRMTLIISFILKLRWRRKNG